MLQEHYKQFSVRRKKSVRFVSYFIDRQEHDIEGISTSSTTITAIHEHRNNLNELLYMEMGKLRRTQRFSTLFKS